MRVVPMLVLLLGACTGEDPKVSSAVDAGPPAVEDSGVDSGSSSVDAGTEAGPAPCPYDNPGSDAGFVCPGVQTGVCSQLCCVHTEIVLGQNFCADDGGTCPAGVRLHECDWSSGCANGGTCCVVTSNAKQFEAQAECPRHLGFYYWEGSKCVPSAQCPVGAYRACRTDADCTVGKCRRADTPTPAGPFTYGVCLER